MGLFNDIKDFEIDCPKCGEKVGGFQTKDDYYDALYLEKVDFRSVRSFHTFCNNCKLWIEFGLKENWQERTIEDYRMTTGRIKKYVQ